MKLADYLAHPNKCKNCDKPILPSQNQCLAHVVVKQFCDKHCSGLYNNKCRVVIHRCICGARKQKNSKHCFKCRVTPTKKAPTFTEESRARQRLGARKGGLKSAMSQNRRSKNEIAFAEKCSAIFSNVTHNEAFFDGWDADVILHDQKIAILWNGKWHYEKLSKRHSLAQVQQRDIIKLRKIAEAGYMPYVIKDIGKENKSFVESEFLKLCEMVPHDGTAPSSSG